MAKVSVQFEQCRQVWPKEDVKPLAAFWAATSGRRRDRALADKRETSCATRHHHSRPAPRLRPRAPNCASYRARAARSARICKPAFGVSGWIRCIHRSAKAPNSRDYAKPARPEGLCDRHPNNTAFAKLAKNALGFRSASAGSSTMMLTQKPCGLETNWGGASPAHQ